MTVIFDAEPLVAFAFDEPGAATVEQWLDRVYDSEIDGYVTTITLAEFRYVATRYASQDDADAHIRDLLDMGVTEYGIDDLWRSASELKATYSTAIGDAYALSAAKTIETDTSEKTTLLVGADDDYDDFENTEAFGHLIERFRDDPA